MGTTYAEATKRIVATLRKNGRYNPLNMSCLAYVAYPDAKPRNAQGAALSVSKLVSKLCDEKVIRWQVKPMGYVLGENAP